MLIDENVIQLFRNMKCSETATDDSDGSENKCFGLLTAGNAVYYFWTDGTRRPDYSSKELVYNIDYVEGETRSGEHTRGK